MNSHFVRARVASGLFGGALLLTIHCGPASTSTTDSTASSTPPAAPLGVADAMHSRIYGTLLYTKMLGTDHFVDFYEFGSGGTAVHESSSIDNGEALFLDKSMKFDSLAEAFAKLNVSAADVPEPVLQADARAAATRTTVAHASRQTQPVSGASSTQQVLSTPIGCSADAFGDNWGANWFLNNFCITGNFRWCPTNHASAYSGTDSYSWSQWTQLEGDFNLTGHITGTKIPCNWLWCDARTTVFDYDVLPRRVESWTFTDGDDVFEVWGSSQCGHLDVAYLHS